MAGLPADIDRLGLGDLNELVLRLVEETARLRPENAGLREEITRLKGLKRRPKIKPSGMAKTAAERRKTKDRRQQARRGKKTAHLRIDEERILVAEVPPGSRFKALPRTPVRGL